ncbi:Mitotic interactor and substrate of PLK1 [Galemys pyrenaicus]|uniref:Mitotic interactor and substrate of PLK1 n=1 Tax=Galemys pyrenaicus TaxID=202257 RepID=A0A8J6AL08_GALPY|nr:Mitotic interactor and substrate of PLK1 [Galemys pyrenaicus]
MAKAQALVTRDTPCDRAGPEVSGMDTELGTWGRKEPQSWDTLAGGAALHRPRDVRAPRYRRLICMTLPHVSAPGRDAGEPRPPGPSPPGPRPPGPPPPPPPRRPRRLRPASDPPDPGGEMEIPAAETTSQQERLQAIAEKRKRQAEIENKRRQLEDDRRQLQHLKSKALRERWLLEGTPSSASEGDEDMRKQMQEDEQKARRLEESISRLEEEIEVLENKDSLPANTKENAAAPSPAKEGEKTEAVMNSQQTPVGTPKAMYSVEITVEKDKVTGETRVLSSTTLLPQELLPQGVKVYEDETKVVHAVDGTAENGIHQLSSSEVDELIHKADEVTLSAAGSTAGGAETRGAVEEMGRTTPSRREIPGVQAQPGEATSGPPGVQPGQEPPVTMIFMGYQNVEDEAETKKVLGLQDSVTAELVVIEDAATPKEPAPPNGSAAEPPAAAAAKEENQVGLEAPARDAQDLDVKKQRCKCCSVMGCWGQGPPKGVPSQVNSDRPTHKWHLTRGSVVWAPVSDTRSVQREVPRVEQRRREAGEAKEWVAPASRVGPSPGNLAGREGPGGLVAWAELDGGSETVGLETAGSSEGTQELDSVGQSVGEGVKIRAVSSECDATLGAGAEIAPSNPHSPRVTGLALDGDTAYTFELVGVGPEAYGWSQEEPRAWPTDHKVRLDVVQTGVSHTLQAPPARLSPWPPRPRESEDEEMKDHPLDSRWAPPRRPWVLEQERRGVSQGQAVRKSGTAASPHGAPDHKDPKTPDQPQATSLSENAVDTEQIDFLAARQQFLSLERASGEAPQTPSARAAPVHPTPRVSQAPRPWNRPHQANGYTGPAKPPAKEVTVEEKRGRGWSTESGVRAVASAGSWSQEEESPEPPKETPIEREIRLAQERERDLREQRGLQRAASHQELVEIPTRPLLTKVSLTAAPRRERGRPSLYVQRDMAQETQREEDHRREGLHADRATTPSWGPQPGLRRALSSDSVLSLAPDASAAGPPPEVRKVNRIPPDAYHPYLGSGTPQLEVSAPRTYGKPRGPPEDEAKTMGSPKVAGSQRHLSEYSGKTSGIKQEHWQPHQGALRANGGVVRKEYFFLRPLKFKVPDTRQQGEEPRVRDWQAASAPMFRLQRSQSSELLEKEVENVLRREREVAEERRNALFPEVFSPTWDEGSEEDSRSSSRASGTTGSYFVNEPLSFTPIHLHSGLVWTAEPPSEDGSGQTKKEQWYAGINPSDRVNSEVLEATRVTRHKNAMAERWEARIYASEDED